MTAAPPVSASPKEGARGPSVSPKAGAPKAIKGLYDDLFGGWKGWGHSGTPYVQYDAFGDVIEEEYEEYEEYEEVEEEEPESEPEPDVAVGTIITRTRVVTRSQAQAAGARILRSVPKKKRTKAIDDEAYKRLCGFVPSKPKKTAAEIAADAAAAAEPVDPYKKAIDAVLAKERRAAAARRGEVLPEDLPGAAEAGAAASSGGAATGQSRDGTSGAGAGAGGNGSDVDDEDLSGDEETEENEDMVEIVDTGRIVNVLSLTAYYAAKEQGRDNGATAEEFAEEMAAAQAAEERGEVRENYGGVEVVWRSTGEKTHLPAKEVDKVENQAEAKARFQVCPKQPEPASASPPAASVAPPAAAPPSPPPPPPVQRAEPVTHPRPVKKSPPPSAADREAAAMEDNAIIETQSVELDVPDEEKRVVFKTVRKVKKVKRSRRLDSVTLPLYWPTMSGADLGSIAALHNGSITEALHSIGSFRDKKDSDYYASFSPTATRSRSDMHTPGDPAGGSPFLGATSALGRSRSTRGMPASPMSGGGGDPRRSRSQMNLSRSHLPSQSSVRLTRTSSRNVPRSFSLPKTRLTAAPTDASNRSLDAALSADDAARHRVSPPPITRSRHDVTVPGLRQTFSEPIAASPSSPARGRTLSEIASEPSAGGDGGADAGSASAASMLYRRDAHDGVPAHPRRVIVEIDMLNADGQSGTMRYVSSEGLSWAYAFWAGGKDPVSEVRGLHYNADTRQLSDQNGVGGLLKEASLLVELDLINAFANTAGIPHNIKSSFAPPAALRPKSVRERVGAPPRLKGVGAGSRQESPRLPACLASSGPADAISPLLVHEDFAACHPFANSWDVFTSWLSHDAPAGGLSVWGTVHPDIEIDKDTITLTQSSKLNRLAVLRQTLNAGVYSFEFKILSGSRGISLGLCKKEPALIDDLGKMTDSYVYHSIGEIWRSGRELVGAENYTTGDVVTLEVDLTRGTLYWTRNGRAQLGRFGKLLGSFRIVVALSEASDRVQVTQLAGEGAPPPSAATSASASQQEQPMLRRSPSGSPHSAAGSHRSTSHSANGSAVSPLRRPMIARTMITCPLKSGAKSLVGPVDVYVPAGVAATVHLADAGLGEAGAVLDHADGESDTLHGRQKVVLGLSRVKPAWSAAPILDTDMPMMAPFKDRTKIRGKAFASFSRVPR